MLAVGIVRNVIFEPSRVVPRRTVRPGAAETQNDFFNIPLLFISLNEGEISE